MNFATGNGEIKRKLLDPTLGLFVSLYMILLAFFIVLNFISNQNVAKQRAAMESVNSTSDRPFAARSEDPITITPAEKTAPNNEFANEVQGLLTSVINREDRFSTEGGNTLQIDLPVVRFFASNSDVLRQDRDSFISRMSELAGNVVEGERREVEFLFGSGAMGFQNPPGAAMRLSQQRAASLSAALVKQGFPPESLSIGLSAMPADRVVMTFRSRIEADAKMTFSHLIGGAE